MQRPALQSKRVGVLRMAFRACKFSGPLRNALQAWAQIKYFVLRRRTGDEFGTLGYLGEFQGCFPSPFLISFTSRNAVDLANGRQFFMRLSCY